ncbi:prolipoprotein diacylglyceryl transferase [Microbacterium endophyticum]|uniref:Phosphatidylglycerol--prolipoprotein diacylglyceryl transferase n=1 Tax=Microbacterium endophyticum TaxID=1526412 RepID=A0A7W4YMP8_9MICO|nr:prolipoprotein diacylglyceryl transferase [Microbacterium endophyticum]MBB2976705.1 prolipoprotein diacylglyceryl transferase [Microbacterium endophyticum]MBB2977055.1 prolipoprotein diacylglyceryl transferase [Microbacterium endophyticum]NIK36659.1 prolipoprotein diacylglyceryl transferase [Microbacterium endophyticum]
MTFASPSALSGVLASIPSPSISYFDIGPVRIHFYALCIITGIIVAVLLTNRRLTKRGVEPWAVIDVALLAVPLAIIGARIFHVLTHPGFYFGEGKNIWAVFYIWEGGIAIFGALLGGAVGAWLGCKWTGIRFSAFADALAPGMIIAQALGRFGNWFNQELFGLPTDLPWGLEIDPNNSAFPAGLPADTLFHPTFLYEVIWNLLGAAVILWAGRRFMLQWGRLFGLYLIWYSAGRIVWESIRIDPSEIIFGLRTNVWAAIFGVLVGLVVMIVQHYRHTGLEPSPYMPGREWSGASTVQSQEADDYVDVSEPPASTVNQGNATSSAAAN